MPTKQITFHIRQDVQPVYIQRILEIISEGDIVEAKSAHLNLSEAGYTVPLDGVRRSLDMSKKLGLLEQSQRFAYTLTSRGIVCRHLSLYRHEIYSDVMHFLLFASWQLNGQKDYWSWSYAKTCEILWRSRPHIPQRSVVFANLWAEATAEFSDLNPVLGTETVTAVNRWLQQLSPAFFQYENGKAIHSQEREWFSTELALLAVSYLYALQSIPIQTPLLLQPSILRPLCPLCLASVESILKMLEVASRTFSFLDIHTGEWGSSIILREPVDITVFS